MLEVKGRYVGTVRGYGAPVILTGESNKLVNNFSSWSQFREWVGENDYTFKGNLVYKKID
jgi:hypothetical protein